MRIDIEEHGYMNCLIMLNDRMISTALAADDEEGWVEIPDIRKMAPLRGSKIDMTEPDEWQVVPRKRLYGQVRIVVKAADPIEST